MAKRFISFFMLLMMAGSALAGYPLHSGEKECSMGGMTGEMDCCATARMKADKPEVRAARLCCALNCTESGATAPGGSFRVSPQLVIALQDALTPSSPLLSIREASRAYSPFGQIQQSHPAYIRHLALLI